MWLDFFSQNTHFAINLFATLVSLGIAWLYLDAWTAKHDKKELFKWVGFGLLGISFLLQATIIEQSVLGQSLTGHWVTGFAIASRLLAYVCIILGQLLDPLQIVPNKPAADGTDTQTADKNPVTKETAKPEEIKTSRALLPLASISGKIMLPLGGMSIAYLYWHRATKGLERHYKPVARAFLLVALSDLIGLTSLLRDTTNPILYTWVAAFGWIWWLQQVTLLLGIIILGFWTWGYLLQRFFSQLFMIFCAMVVIVFLVVSVGFTGLLLRNIESDSLVNLHTAAQVLDYALESKQNETNSAAGQLSGSSEIAAAVGNNDREKLKSLTENFLSDKRLSGLTITNQSGQVLLRAEDSDQWGDSLSNDPLVKRSLVGLNQSTIAVLEGVGAPIVQVRSAMPIKSGSGDVMGSVVASLDLDTAFVDGIKKSTDLQSSIYGGNTLAATTLTSSEDKARPVGVKLSDGRIKDTVLSRGETTDGTITLQHRQVLAVFAPIKDVDNVPVGMLMIAQSKSKILMTAGHSVELTFMLAAVLLVISIYPILWIVKGLVRQLA